MLYFEWCLLMCIKHIRPTNNDQQCDFPFNMNDQWCDFPFSMNDQQCDFSFTMNDQWRDFLCQNNEGILAMLDDECLRPGAVTDMTFLAKLNVACCNHKHFESRGCRKTQSDTSLPHDAFKLIHYAGEVCVSSPILGKTFDKLVDNNDFRLIPAIACYASWWAETELVITEFSSWWSIYLLYIVVVLVY